MNQFPEELECGRSTSDDRNAWGKNGNAMVGIKSNGRRSKTERRKEKRFEMQINSSESCAPFLNVF